MGRNPTSGADAPQDGDAGAAHDARPASDSSLRELAGLFTEVGEQLHGLERLEDALTAVPELAVQWFNGAQIASITQLRRDSFETVAATDPRARQADQIQYSLNSGPCVDAIVDQTTYRIDDLNTDPRWPEYGARAVAEVGLVSMLSFRLVGGADGIIGGLNMYSEHRDAFTDSSESMGVVMATYAGLAVAAAASRETVSNLQRALESNREIGTAMGVLMARLKIPREQAFGLLRMASQSSNRKLRDIATEVVDTGTLDLPAPQPRPAHPPRRG